MMYVLDTNAVSALMRGDGQAIQWLRSHARSEVLVPQPVLAEIAYGIERLPRTRRRARLLEQFELIRCELAHAGWTDEVTDSFGLIKAALEKKGERIEDFDIAIAAHARAQDAVLVTADFPHMGRVAGLRLESMTR
jgi:tRNA(fMet)-specific endonuclease VapC